MTTELQSINPANGELLRSFPALEEEALRQRIALAAEAAGAHSLLPFEDRARCLRKLARLLLEEQDDVARTITLETGKPLLASAAEVLRCRDLCLFYAKQGARLLAPEVLQTSGNEAGRMPQSYLSWSPLGVVLAVVSWESPMLQACRIVLPALTAGNAVLLKHASSVPQCPLLLETLVRRAGFLRGVVNSLLMEDRLVEAALHDARVAAVTVAGTESACRALTAQAGWLLKRSSSAVTGTGATVVMPSADMDGALAAAVDALVAGAEAGKRLIVHSGIYSDFVRGLVKAVESLRTGDPLRAETQVGALGTRAALETLSHQVDAAVMAGGRVLAGGTPLVGSGSFFEPTLLGDVPRASTTALEVMTGPIATVTRARDAEDAVRIANTAPHAGESSVWTREPAEQQQMVAGITGTSVALNISPWSVGEVASKAPVGTWQPGSIRLREFMKAKTVLLG